MDSYLSLPLHADTQDLYYARTAIRDALCSQLPRFTGTFLDIGCGSQPYRSLITSPPSRVANYLGMDLPQSSVGIGSQFKVDIEWDGVQMPIETASVDSAMATEVLEHCPDPLTVLQGAHRVIRSGGVLFLTVPFLWPLHTPPHDEYRYTTFAMERILARAGFSEIVVKPLGGWDASLAQMIGLWALRRPMADWQRRLVKRATVPLVSYLIKHDEIPDPRNSPMITGLWATAVRP